MDEKPGELTRPSIADAWDRIVADPRLARARNALSSLEMRLIIHHAQRAVEPKPHEIRDLGEFVAGRKGKE